MINVDFDDTKQVLRQHWQEKLPDVEKVWLQLLMENIDRMKKRISPLSIGVASIQKVGEGVAQIRFSLSRFYVKKPFIRNLCVDGVLMSYWY